MIIEFVMLAAVIGAAWLLVVRLENGNVVIDRTLGVLAFTAGVAASILLVVAAWMSGNRRARRIAAAVGIYTCVPLLVRVVGIASPHALWVVGRGVAVLAVVGLLVLALRGSTNVRRDRAAALAMIGIAVAGIVVVRTIRALFPAYLPPAWFPAAADLLAWSGAGAVSLLLLATGVRTDRALLRRVGLAVATLAAAHALSIVGDLPRDPARWSWPRWRCS